MATKTFPANFPTKAEWRLVSNTMSFKSPLDGSIQTSETPGARWRVSLMFPKQSPADGRILAAFLTSLRGESGRFWMHDHTQPLPRGIVNDVDDTPVVSGAAQTGATLAITGLRGSTAGLFLAGDMIGFGSVGNEELHMVSEDSAPSAPGGTLTLNIEPPIRTSPANGAQIVIDSPVAVFKLTTDEQAKWNVSPYLYGLQIICEEAF